MGNRHYCTVSGNGQLNSSWSRTTIPDVDNLHAIRSILTNYFLNEYNEGELLGREIGRR